MTRLFHLNLCVKKIFGWDIILIPNLTPKNVQVSSQFEPTFWPYSLSYLNRLVEDGKVELVGAPRRNSRIGTPNNFFMNPVFFSYGVSRYRSPSEAYQIRFCLIMLPINVIIKKGRGGETVKLFQFCRGSASVFFKLPSYVCSKLLE